MRKLLWHRKLLVLFMAVALLLTMAAFVVPVMAGNTGTPAAQGSLVVLAQDTGNTTSAASIVSNIEMWALITGFFLPLIVAALIRTKWPSWARATFAFLACMGAAAGTVALTGQLTTANWVAGSLTVLVAAITSFKGIWQQIGVVQKIEGITNPGSSTVTEPTASSAPCAGTTPAPKT